MPVGFRDGITAEVSENGNLLTIDLGMNLQHASTVGVTVGVDIDRVAVDAGTKAVNRDQYVKIRIANNVGGVSGPWCLGLADIIRLKGVYKGTTVNVSTSDLDVTDDFYIDHNQNKNFLDLGYLYMKPGSGVGLLSTDFLRVKFDYLSVATPGFMDTVSYLSANAAQICTVYSTPLANLTNLIWS